MNEYYNQLNEIRKQHRESIYEAQRTNYRTQLEPEKRHSNDIGVLQRGSKVFPPRKVSYDNTIVPPFNTKGQSRIECSQEESSLEEHPEYFGEDNRFATRRNCFTPTDQRPEKYSRKNKEPSILDNESIDEEYYEQHPDFPEIDEEVRNTRECKRPNSQGLTLPKKTKTNREVITSKCYKESNNLRELISRPPGEELKLETSMGSPEIATLVVRRYPYEKVLTTLSQISQGTKETEVITTES